MFGWMKDKGTVYHRILKSFITEEQWNKIQGRAVVEIYDDTWVRQETVHVDPEFFGQYGFEKVDY